PPRRNGGGRAQAGFGRKPPPRFDDARRVLFGMKRLKRLVDGAQRHSCRRRADDAAALANDSLGHGLERDRLRQRRAQVVEAMGPRGERPIARLAFAVGVFGATALLELRVGAGPERVAVKPRALRAVVRARALERACRDAATVEQVLALLVGERSRTIECER